MKSTIFIFLLLLACTVDAQTGEYYFTSNPFEYDGYYLTDNLMQTKIAHKIKSITETTTTFKKGNPEKATLKKVSTLNEKGETILKEEYDAKGLLIRKQSFGLNDSGWVEQKKIADGKGKVMYQYDKKYDPETGNIISYEYRKNDKLKSKYTKVYTGKNLTEQVVYKKDGLSVSKRFAYSFNSDMKLQTTHLYDGNGKLIHTWNHDCLPEGELLAARTDTTTICKMHEERADGGFVNYLKSVNEKGELTTTTVWYRNERMTDSAKVVTEGKHPHTMITRFSDDGRRTERIYMDDKNNITFKYFRLLSENGNQLKYENWTYSKKHGLQCTLNAVSEENAEGLLTKKSIYRKDKLSRETNFSYTYF
ncbi:MAG: hypothetical protein A2W93_03235 [Bacteroidetes bacterium GWF2_43_63]|nr:MAG: hypothetical protein A2W94_09235 [Bacteroidetes bacterium GWE2_42_42]OFY53674.1 MAG: hypothetical protein A2W93_03235 [Bacteroidetes bacterium GWF2_43_63]HBG70981.1 hypothetical protein [Bacteroidales bacterium]HCB62928.1 hypothetical protein [Bacteroidales bacterium]HCY24308.1 hypothetical protein [Bacteroidales bacterium]